MTHAQHAKADSSPCLFCGIVAGTVPASIVMSDALTMAFGVRQFHAGHVLVIPREHGPDIRLANDVKAAPS